MQNLKEKSKHKNKKDIYMKAISKKVVVKTAHYDLEKKHLLLKEIKSINQILNPLQRYGSLLATWSNEIMKNKRTRWGVKSSDYENAKRSVFLKIDGKLICWRTVFSEYIPVPTSIPANKEIVLPYLFKKNGQWTGSSCLFNIKFQLLMQSQNSEEVKISESDIKWLTNHYKNKNKEKSYFYFNYNLKTGWFTHVGENIYRLSLENKHLCSSIISIDPSKATKELVSKKCNNTLDNMRSLLRDFLILFESYSKEVLSFVSTGGK